MVSEWCFEPVVEYPCAKIGVSKSYGNRIRDKHQEYGCSRKSSTPQKHSVGTDVYGQCGDQRNKENNHDWIEGSKDTCNREVCTKYTNRVGGEHEVEDVECEAHKNKDGQHSHVYPKRSFLEVFLELTNGFLCGITNGLHDHIEPGIVGSSNGRQCIDDTKTSKEHKSRDKCP